MKESKRSESAEPRLKTEVTVEKKEAINQGSEKSTTADSQTNESEMQNDIDMLGYLDVDQLDNVLTLADNMAIKLAYQTTMKMKSFHGKMKNQIKSE